MIDINKQIEYWKNGAESDIETAKILISNKKYLQGLFFCHLSIEKIIKAHIAKVTKEIPPYSHNLIFLLEKTKITISDDDKDFLGILIKYQLEGRYPNYSPFIPDVDTINNYICKTKDLLKWFKEKL